MAALQRPLPRAAMLLVSVAALVAAAFGLYAWHSAKEEQLSSLDNLALLTARSSGLFFRHFELSLQTLAQDVQAAGGSGTHRAVHDLLVRFKTTDDRIAIVNLFSVEGLYLASSNVPYGEALPRTQDNPAIQASIRNALALPGLQLGPPIYGPISKQWVISLRYAVRDEAGEPRFILSANVPLSREQEIWRPVSLTGNGAIGLLRDDGVLQARWPEVPNPQQVYSAPNKGILLDTLRANAFPHSGRVEGMSTLVPEYRLISYRRLTGYPLTAYVAMSRGVIWENWLRRVWMPFLLFALLTGYSIWIYRKESQHQLQKEQALRDRHTSLELQNEITALANRQLKVEDLIQAILRVVVQRFDGVWGAYCSIDPGGQLQIKASVEPPAIPSTIGLTLDLSRFPLHLAGIRAGKSIADAGADLLACIDFPVALSRVTTLSVLGAPLSDHQGLLHLLCLGTLNSKTWRDSDIALLSQIAAYLSLALKEAHFKLERERAIAKNEESETRFRELTELSSDWYWEQDENLRFTFFSEGFLRKGGASPAASLGKTRREQPGIVLSENEWSAHQATLDARESFQDLTYQRLAMDGTSRQFSISGRPIFDAQGNFRGYRGVGRDITEKKAAEERIQFLAYHDGHTTLPNRAHFSQILHQGIVRAQRNNQGLAVLFLDLDRFKNINDTLGHEAGDTYLQEIGRRLGHCVRQSDTVARLGGDEFVILLEELREPAGVATAAGKIVAAVVKPFEISGHELRLTASIGISVYPQDGEDEQTLMTKADIAMYHAKGEGKNNFQFHSEQLKTNSFERLALESSLRRALERNEFQVHYQPKIELHGGKVVGMEALIRWQHPDLGLVSPLQFISLAEETGLIVPIGRWVLRTACLQTKAWREEKGLPPMTVAVNLSARQFSDANLLPDIASILEETAMDPAFLELEITESMIMRNVDKTLQTMTALKNLGIRLAIDDFGTGYSSLAHLKQFPLDTLKIDRSFIRDLPGDQDDAAITKAIIALGKNLNMTLVAEGVETLEQAEFLRAHSCEQCQGYYFSKPLDPENFSELLRSSIAQTGWFAHSHETARKGFFVVSGRGGARS